MMCARVALCVAAAAVFASCGGAPPSACDGVSADLGKKPSIDVPDASPPSAMRTTDLVQGDGDEAKEGSVVTVHYVGVSWSTGEQFDASWDRDSEITFGLDGVIPGWQEGIPGMKVGGRRCLELPPDKAYGDAPPPGSGIAPGETLVFVVDLKAVED